MPSRSFSQSPTTSSASAAAGEVEGVVGVLVPARGEQVRAGGGVEGPADDEPEVAGSSRGDQRRLGRGDQPVENGVGRLALVRQRTPESGPRRLEIEAWTDPGLGGVRPVGVDPAGGADEQAVGHVPHVTTGV